MAGNKEPGFRKFQNSVKVIWDAFLKDEPEMGL